MAIVTLDEVKAHLNKTSTSSDPELQDFIDAATPIVEEYVGPVEPNTFVERHPEGQKIRLFEQPVISVDAVEPWLTEGTTYAPDDLQLDGRLGKVERLDGEPFTGGPFKVTYTAGRSVVPENIKKATLIIVAHMWKTQRGRMPDMPVDSRDDSGPVPTTVTYAVPRRALEYLKPDEPIMDSVVVA